jgi:hypothetical protein
MFYIKAYLHFYTTLAEILIKTKKIKPETSDQEISDNIGKEYLQVFSGSF